MAAGPKRRAEDHVHPEYWAREDQHRFEDRIAEELKGMRDDLEKLASRVLIIFGGVAVLAFIIPLVVPLVRDWLNVPAQLIP